MVPGAARVPRAQPSAVRRPDLLHLSLRADRARHAASRRTRASSCRPRTTSRRSISRSTRSCSARRPAIAYNTDVERRFLTTHFSIRAVEEETVGCGVDLPQAQSHQRDDAGRRRDATIRTPRPMPDEERPPSWRPHLAGRGVVVPAPAPAARADRALRRPHRSGQGLRGADRVLQQLRAGGRRRVAGADGRQADAAARGAVHPVRRPAARTRSACRRSKPPPSSSCRRRTRACRCSRSKRSPSARRSSPTRAARCWSITARRATPASTTRTATSSSSALKLLVADHRLRARDGPQRPRLRAQELPLGRDHLPKYERMFAQLRGR